MVEGLDADLINMDLVNTQPNSMILPSGLGQYCNPGVAGAYKAGAYMVNQNGERFFNESANAWDLMQAMKQNEAQYLIMDQTAFDNFNAGMTNSKIYTMEDVEKWLNDDYDGQPVMKQGATLAELCERLRRSWKRSIPPRRTRWKPPRRHSTTVRRLRPRMRSDARLLRRRAKKVRSTRFRCTSVTMRPSAVCISTTACRC